MLRHRDSFNVTILQLAQTEIYMNCQFLYVPMDESVGLKFIEVFRYV